jgi:hypothetical protein
MGDTHQASNRAGLPLALAGKTMVDGIQAARLSRDQWTRHGAFCFWCLMAGASFATIPFSLGEAREAVRSLLGRRQ